MTAAFRKITPEEKLLHIIEGSQNTDKSSLNKADKEKERPSLFRSVDLSALFDKADFKKITLRGVNKVLAGLSAILTLLLVVYLLNNQEYMRARFEEIKTKRIKKEALQLDVEQKGMPDVSSYISDTTKRNPFHLLPFVEKARPKGPEETINLRLVGILWSDRSQAIIEDSVSKKTFMVYEGDTIDKYTVKEITQTEVKLSSQDGDKILR